MTPLSASRLVHPMLARLQRVSRVELCAGMVASVAALLLGLTLGESAARSNPVGSVDGALRVAALTRGDLREVSLKLLTDGMDPAALALARRFDRFAPTPRLLDLAAPGSDTELAPFSPIEGDAARQINAAIPFAAEGVVAARPFVLDAPSGAEWERAVHCLTNAIYYEAALEPEEGQRAVAQVVLNRVRNPNFPKSICEVVYEGWQKPTGCQFSFTCDGALSRQPMATLWRDDRRIAEQALAGSVMPAVGNATHYHADYVSPYWAPNLVKITKIGAHIFYRWPGSAGLPQAFTSAYRGGELRITEAVLYGRAPRPLQAPTQVTAAMLQSLPGQTLPGLPGLRGMTFADAAGRTQARIGGAFAVAGQVAGLPAPIYGRRPATPEEIARINAMLEARFPTRTGEAVVEPVSGPAASPAPDAGG